MSCTEEEKVQWAKDNLSSTISKFALSGDRVEEIVVVDDLYDTICTALTDVPLPLDFPIQENMTRDQIERDFKQYCSMVVVRTASIDQLALPDESIAPDVLFIRPVTSRMKYQGFIDQWDRSVGFSQALRAMGCPFEFSPDEKKLIMGLTMALGSMMQQAAGNNMPTATPDLFKID